MEYRAFLSASHPNPQHCSRILYTSLSSQQPADILSSFCISFFPLLKSPKKRRRFSFVYSQEKKSKCRFDLPSTRSFFIFVSFCCRTSAACLLAGKHWVRRWLRRQRSLASLNQLFIFLCFFHIYNLCQSQQLLFPSFRIYLTISHQFFAKKIRKNTFSLCSAIQIAFIQKLLSTLTRNRNDSEIIACKTL